MKYIAAGADEHSGIEVKNPDINYDDKVDVVDLVRLMKLISKY